VYCRDHHTHVHFHASDYYAKQAKVVSQEKFSRASVLVVGAGGLGCPALPSLATAGVGRIGIVDSDRIEISNVHRQPLFSPAVVGESKAVVAQKKMLELNPFIKVAAINERLHAGNALSLIEGYDLVLDCTDNMDTKFTLQDACLKAGKPLVSASIYQHEGQLRTLIPGSSHGCFRCHQTETPDDSLLGNCNDFGVLGAWTAVLGTMQAAQALELLQTGTNSTASHTLLVNLRDLSTIKVKNTAREGCAHCAGDFELTESELEVSPTALREPNTIFVDMREEADEHLRQFIGRPAKIVVGCHRGIRSKRLVKAFRAEGHENFYSLRGGATALVTP
jgi:adenylyltransferase/sulfurtransferase